MNATKRRPTLRSVALLARSSAVLALGSASGRITPVLVNGQTTGKSALVVNGETYVPPSVLTRPGVKATTANGALDPATGAAVTVTPPPRARAARAARTRRRASREDPSFRIDLSCRR